jgi:hypothetical protein
MSKAVLLTFLTWAEIPTKLCFIMTSWYENNSWLEVTHTYTKYFAKSVCV